MIKLKPYSASLLIVAGLLLVAMGIYFVVVRLAFLPEDLYYTKSSPGLSAWLKNYFWVIGGYIFTTGLLIIFIAITSFRKRLRGAFSIVALAGISIIGLMAVVNFMIGLEYKWMLLTFTLPWIISLMLYRVHK